MKNNKLNPVKLPMEQKWNKEPETKFINNLDSINVKLIDCPSIDQLLSYIPQFVSATWADEPNEKKSFKESSKLLYDALHFKTLPTALETIGLTFSISGISMQEVTHIIRYRKASFSAECSGDKWWTDQDALIPNSVQNSNEFNDRYMDLVKDSKQLYCDMIDSKKISIMDARYILPRCLSTFYYMRMSFGDAIHFIRQRIDKQIQPETDNIIAYQMYAEILKNIPLSFGLVDIHSPSIQYINSARTGKGTNLYFPDKDSDKFEWNEKDFIYHCERSEMNGTNENAINLFNIMLRFYEQEIKMLEDRGKIFYELMLNTEEKEED